MLGLMKGDSTRLLKHVKPGVFDLIYTDPIWPNSSVEEFKGIDALKVFRKTAKYFPKIADRVAVHMGCDSDPRFLEAIPKEMKFFRVCYLRYAVPSYKGRVLYDGDIVYIFGKPPKSKQGKHLLGSGLNVCHTDKNESRNGHPCPRRLIHTKWVLSNFAERAVLDPFSGSGTTAEACIDLNLKYLCIEIKENYHAEACKRIKNRILCGISNDLFAKNEDFLRIHPEDIKNCQFQL